ncbi:hypothetical protein LP422_05435 [Janibacter limosus]|uniref:Uncharacterized protein n=1 Tax=Janibacter limosus TaxID=53458 RepID=A0AC61U673_9MICO|nr:hypothetical protein [Janibacter limosus]UUZ45542.1 hypothetical protein LP422_05435 [Janibacter limosus]
MTTMKFFTLLRPRPVDRPPAYVPDVDRRLADARRVDPRPAHLSFR